MDKKAIWVLVIAVVLVVGIVFASNISGQATIAKSSASYAKTGAAKQPQQPQHQSDAACADLDDNTEENSYADISSGRLGSVVAYVSKMGATIDNKLYPPDKKWYGKHYLRFDTIESDKLTVRVCQKNGDNWFVGGTVYTVPSNGNAIVIDDGFISYIEYLPTANGALVHISMDN